MLAACAGGGRDRSAPSYPESGLLLLSLAGGSPVRSAAVGKDLVAVAVSEDGGTAFAADSAPGDVYAVRLPDLSIAWKQHLGGAPFGLLAHGGLLYVSLFEGDAVVALDPATGARAATHPVPHGAGAMTVDAQGRIAVAGTRGTVQELDGRSLAAGNGFAVALAGATLWTADYERAELVPAGGGPRVGLPLPVSPFWLAPGPGGTILVAAEGPDEDRDRGAVLSFDPASGAFQTLARPRDPDQVVWSGGRALVAAHGDREVLVIEGGRTRHWAGGAAAVALAPDPVRGLLVVAVNAHE